jgi:hypothetical protein
LRWCTSVLGSLSRERNARHNPKETIMSTYVIRNAGQYESTLASTGTPIRATVYTDRRAAMLDLARVARLHLPDMVACAGGDSDWYVYASQEDADADDTGESAMAIVATAASVAREVAAGVFD